MGPDTGTSRPLFRRLLVALFAAVLVATRIFATPKTLFEWDDYIFGLTMHLYAPQADVPQAPFFPVFVYAARLARLVFRHDVRALTSVSVLASTAALPLMYAAAKELYGSTPLAARAVAIYAFLPAIWFYAGTPITDTAGAAASLLAFWLAVRAMRRPDRLPLAMAVFGAACGVRPQSLVPAILPLVLAARTADRGTVLRAIAAGAAAVAVFAVAPVVGAAGGFAPLIGPLWERLSYTGSSTSIFSGVDPWYVARRWLRDPWVSKWLAVAVAAFLVAGAAARDRLDRSEADRPGADDPGRLRRPTRLLLSSFAPYALLCVLFLDPTFGSRYLLPAMPLVALLVAAAALELERSLRLPVAAVTAAFVAGCAILVAPAITIVHDRPAPAEEAAARLRARATAPYALLYSEEMFAPTELLFPGVPKYAVEKTSPDGLRAATALPLWRFGVGSMTDPSEAVCWPPLPALQRLTPGRYLTVPFGPWSRDTPSFGEGWSGEQKRAAEGCAADTFRWISSASAARTRYPQVEAARRLLVEVEPERILAPPATLSVTWNGVSLGRVRLDAAWISFRAAVPRARSSSELVLTVEPPPRSPQTPPAPEIRTAVRRLSLVPDPETRR